MSLLLLLECVQDLGCGALCPSAVLVLGEQCPAPAACLSATPAVQHLVLVLVPVPEPHATLRPGCCTYRATPVPAASRMVSSCSAQCVASSTWYLAPATANASSKYLTPGTWCVGPVYLVYGT